MHQKKKPQMIGCIILIVLNLCFIWGNSLLPGAESAELSGGILEQLQEILGPSFEGSEFLIRKLAHFSEFACLGLLLAWLFRLLSQQGIHLFTMPLLCGSLSALLDETIQVLTPERGPSVVDVWIDTAGVLTGILVMWLFYRMFVSRKHK